MIIYLSSPLSSGNFFVDNLPLKLTKQIKSQNIYLFVQNDMKYLLKESFLLLFVVHSNIKLHLIIQKYHFMGLKEV